MNIVDNFGKAKKDERASKEEYIKGIEEGNHKFQGRTRFSMTDKDKDRMLRIDHYGNAKSFVIDRILYEHLLLFLEAGNKIDTPEMSITIKDKGVAINVAELYYTNKFSLIPLELHDKYHNLYHKITRE